MGGRKLPFNRPGTSPSPPCQNSRSNSFDSNSADASTHRGRFVQVHLGLQEGYEIPATGTASYRVGSAASVRRPRDSPPPLPSKVTAAGSRSTGGVQNRPRASSGF